MGTVSTPASARNADFVNHAVAPVPQSRRTSSTKSATASEEFGNQVASTKRDADAYHNAVAVEEFNTVLGLAEWDDPGDRVLQTALWIIGRGRTRPYRAGVETIAKVARKSVSWVEHALPAMLQRQADGDLVGVVRTRPGRQGVGTSEWDAAPALRLFKTVRAVLGATRDDDEREERITAAVVEVRGRPRTATLLSNLKAQLERQGDRPAAPPRVRLTAEDRFVGAVERALKRLKSECETDDYDGPEYSSIWTEFFTARLLAESPEVEDIEDVMAKNETSQPVEITDCEPSAPVDSCGHLLTQVGGEELPDGLPDLPVWVCWKYGEARANGKREKIPHDPITDMHASVAQPSTWATYDRAVARFHAGGYDGIGAVLVPEAGLVVVDLDGVRDPVTGELELEAQRIIDDVDSLTEISPSGTGVHIWLRGTLPPTGRRRGNVEMYSSGRFIAWTGVLISGSTDRVQDRDDEVNALHGRVFGPKEPTLSAALPPCVVPLLVDEEIVQKARRAGDADRFERLYAGDVTGYTSHSEADLALAGIFARHTTDAAQVDRLFRSSRLLRQKWDRGGYGERTIRLALAGRR